MKLDEITRHEISHAEQINFINAILLNICPDFHW